MDFDVSAEGLESPPASAPLQTYAPAISVKNNGVHPALVTGTLQIIDATTGAQVFLEPVSLTNLQPGETGIATTGKDWTPAHEGPHYAFGFVTTEHDQNPRNDQLSPTLISVLPPPPPPVPATLDDVVAALEPLALDTTVTDVVDKLPLAPATEPTQEQVRDKLPNAPATEPTLQLIAETLDNPLSFIAAATVPTKPVPATTYQANGVIPLPESPMSLVFQAPTRSIIVQALTTNTGKVYLGDEQVSSQGEHAIAVLNAGDAIVLDFDAVNGHFWLVGSEAGQQICSGALYL